MTDTKVDKHVEFSEDLLTEVSASLFIDSMEIPYVSYRYKEKQKTIPLRCREFRNFVGYRLVANNRKPTKDTIETVVSILDAKAAHEGLPCNLAIRVRDEENLILYDLGDKCVTIDKEGWEVIDCPPLAFKRFPHNKKQVTPLLSDHTIWDLFALINVTDEDDQLLLICFLVASFIPNIPHPILVVYGCKGAAKTGLTRILVDLIDPSQSEDIDPQNQRDLFLIAGQRWLLPMDNMGRVNSKLSDVLCKFATGAGFNQRRLYTDEDLIVRKLQRVVILNGINLPIEKPDLLDRTILLQLQRIEPKDRLEDVEVISKFASMKPHILGSIFSILSKAMSVVEEVSLTEKPRMADFAKWGEAICLAVGCEPGRFMKIYEKNVTNQTEEALDASPVASTIIHCLQSTTEISGTPSEVWKRLHYHAPDAGIEQRYFPQSHRSFGRKLKECQSDLESIGITVERSRGASRWIKISSDKLLKANDENVDSTTGKTFDQWSSSHVNVSLSPNELESLDS